MNNTNTSSNTTHLRTTRMPSAARPTTTGMGQRLTGIQLNTGAIRCCGETQSCSNELDIYFLVLKIGFELQDGALNQISEPNYKNEYTECSAVATQNRTGCTTKERSGQRFTENKTDRLVRLEKAFILRRTDSR